MKIELIWGMLILLLAIVPSALAENYAGCQGTTTADVVALDNAFYYNRLGAYNPAGMIYALRTDIALIDEQKGPIPGNVKLRDDKRPRPLVIRVNAGDCLNIKFQNLLSPDVTDDNQPSTRTASVHVVGLQLVNSILDDGSNVGMNPSSIIAPGESATYSYYAEKENTYMLYSPSSAIGGEGDGGSLSAGLFGAVNVEPKGAEWYRSQLTEQEISLATTGTTPDGHPIINYDAVYPAGHKFEDLPIIKMVQGNEIVHSDLNAIITGPNRQKFPEGTYPKNPVIAPLPELPRETPFREFTVIFHDEIIAKQAFDAFEDENLEFTLHSVRDGFAINYGSAAIGSEVLANRLGVGPAWDCVECKFEEFFLTSWAVGDPAMIVDIPANTVDDNGTLIKGPKATKALYPDDPSNVHHSYLNDHVKFRNIHVGPKEHHIFHLHAHQWLFNADDDNGFYTDSQALGPGSAYTYDTVYMGSGNRNKGAGDSIFHCHFYPHFAQGMWELWRVHDVFEAGTTLDEYGTPANGSRALPDGEINSGTPIPAIVPIPTLAMAPMPGPARIYNGQAVIENNDTNPGYPFFIPGIAGHRPPHPPLDTVFDGGLPRHIVLGGEATSFETSTNFNKHLDKVDAVEIPENGSTIEKIAMDFHAQRLHPSYTPDGIGNVSFVTNGLPPVPGAPFADPCVDDYGNSIGVTRTYKAAAMQLDIRFNKEGDHFPQSRLLALWEDVGALLNNSEAPEPFFFRANTNDCINFYHTNLIPNAYKLDDFQIEAPTDIVGQHIHLVKFDVTSSDGSSNGFNYEDGTFSPDEVKERINAINSFGGFLHADNTTSNLTPAQHPFFKDDKGLGAQITVQRWFADNVLNNNGEDRTLRTVFSHDHMAPSTHQQTGLYSALVIEPEFSIWRNPETGEIMGNRSVDGGPTSWRADIITDDQDNSYREFLFQAADFQLAYKANRGIDEYGNPVPDREGAINPPARDEVGLPFLLQKAQQCPNNDPPPCPEAISADDVGTFSVNYRNEPLAYRIRNPNTNSQASGIAGDLSFAYRSDIERQDPLLNVQPDFYPNLTKGLLPGDPFTPLLRAYEGDKIQVRYIVGATEETHIMTIQGMKWLQEPDAKNSGFRNSQMSGISEHFELNGNIPAVPSNIEGDATDYLYMNDASSDGQWNGIWGILRAYRTGQDDLLALPGNPGPITNAYEFNGVCPAGSPIRSYDITVVSAQQALPGGTLVYNPRNDSPGTFKGPIHDRSAVIYVLTANLNDGILKPNTTIEPLILRANAGDCIEVVLRNNLAENLIEKAGFSTLPMIVDNFNSNQINSSLRYGLHPQLIAFDGKISNGANVGMNSPEQTAGPGELVAYRWYAGDLSQNSDGSITAKPIEFGSINLIPSDIIKHSTSGSIAALIIEPQESVWEFENDSRASATIHLLDGSMFREFVLLFQDDLNLADGNNDAIPNIAGAEDPEDSGQKAFNYRTDPLWLRMGVDPTTSLTELRTLDFSNVLSNSLNEHDPATPLFTANAGDEVRFRIVEPAGHARNHVFALNGHSWQRQPYRNDSANIGNNPNSFLRGAQEGIGPSNHFDILTKAGGNFEVPGDYLYRDQSSFQFYDGLWGIFRVTHKNRTNIICGNNQLESEEHTIFTSIHAGEETQMMLGGQYTTIAVLVIDNLSAIVGVDSGLASLRIGEEAQIGEVKVKALDILPLTTPSIGGIASLKVTSVSMEQCDDGNTYDDDGCSSICRTETCGDGTQHPTEQCDDGNNDNGDGCDSKCNSEFCGDNIVNHLAEKCDRGNANGQECTANYEKTCTYCSTTCQLVDVIGAFCGDDIRNGNEKCDGTDGITGTESCSTDCAIISTNNVCGDGILDGVESCDDGNTLSKDGCDEFCRIERDIPEFGGVALGICIMGAGFAYLFISRKK